jgi:DeoR/GlpR family transcriptional regulator of sugar metabolism
MSNKERQQKIVEYLKVHNSASVDELAENVYASLSTIRRDLSELEGCGFVYRYHGCAIINIDRNEGMFSHFRESTQVDEKSKIADLAERFIKSSASYFFDASTTCIPLAMKLKKFHDIKLVTNGLHLTTLFTQDPQISITCTGGDYNTNYEDFGGAVALNTINMMHADFFFFSCSGFSLDMGTTDRRDPIYKKAFWENSGKHILLCCSSKFDKNFFYKCFKPSDIDYIVTDKKPENPAYEEFLGDRLIYK